MYRTLGEWDRRREEIKKKTKPHIKQDVEKRRMPRDGQINRKNRTTPKNGVDEDKGK